MNCLEERIQKYIDDVDTKLQHTFYEKDRLLLYYDIENIIKIIFYNDLMTDIPDSFKEYLKNDFTFSDEFLMEDNNIFWSNFYSMYDTNMSICSMLDYLPSSKTHVNLFNHNYSFDKAIKITQGFFDMYDRDISKHFKYIIDNNFLIRPDLSDDNCLGMTISISSSKKSFILIDKNVNDINLLMTLAHETVHSYISSFTYNISYDEKAKMNLNSLYEVYSYFIEFVFAHYLHDINKIDISGVYESYYNILISSIKSFKNVFSKFCNAKNNYYDVDRYACEEALVYGIILAYHYYDSYLKNPELVKDDLINLMIDSKKYDKHVLLNNYGLNECDLYDYKILTKRL